jgi:predicted DNA-binding transcriptional regulator YafY
MYHPTTRVLAVLELLQLRRHIGGAELAGRLEVDGRTIRRYVAMLQDLGIPIQGERGRHGGYRLRPGFRLPPLMFSEGEVLALVLGLLAARRLGLAAAAPAVEGALAEIERVLSEALGRQVQALLDTLTLDLAPSDAPAAGEVVVALTTAAREERCVWLRYRSWPAEAETERIVDPYGVVYPAGRWYAVGYCHLRSAPRVFRLDRVLEAAVRDETFARPLGFDSEAYVLRALATVPRPWPVEVVLETTLDDARDRVSPAVALLQATPEGVVLRCDTENLAWMARYLARLGCPLLVHRPPELRAALRQHADEIIRSAERVER